MSVFSQPIRRVGFTLNELLIVIAIIVLMLALAVPAFNALTGSKSIEGATNQVSAFLGQARAEAIGIQETRGVMFFFDLATERINMAIVRGAYTDAAGIVYLDLVPDRDFLALPPGIGLQTIDNPQSVAAVPDDTYLGFNEAPVAAALPSANVLYGGAILFDAYGKLTSAQYGFHCSASATAAAPTTAGPLTVMGSYLSSGGVGNAGSGTTAKDYWKASPTTVDPYMGQFGLVLYDREAFANCITGTSSTARKEDFQINGGSWSAGQPEYDREQWLTNNASIVLINRYNGTLIKGD